METGIKGTGMDFTAFARQLTVIYYAIMASMAGVYVVVILVLAPGAPVIIAEGKSQFLLIVPVINFIVVATASILFRMRVRAAVATEDLSAKITEYRIGYLVRAALLESLAMLNAFAYYSMRDMKFEILYILVLLLYVISAYPGEDKLRKEMGLRSV